MGRGVAVGVGGRERGKSWSWRGGAYHYYLEHDCNDVAKFIQIVDLFSIRLVFSFSPKSPTSARHSPSAAYPPRGSRRI